MGRQHEPRQGARAAVARQEEVRARALVGRPLRARGHERDRGDGRAVVRLLRGAPRRRGRQRQRRARADARAGEGRAVRRERGVRRAARLDDDRPHLPQPRGADGRARPGGERGRDPRHVRPHGDERLRDGRARRRRPRVRQGARRVPRRRGPVPGRRARGPVAGAVRRDGPRRRRVHVGLRGRVDERAAQVRHRVRRESARLARALALDPRRGCEAETAPLPTFSLASSRFLFLPQDTSRTCSRSTGRSTSARAGATSGASRTARARRARASRPPAATTTARRASPS